MALMLGALWAWDIYDKTLVSIYSKKYKPVPLPANPTYSASDVSIVVPTIDTDSTFTECMRLWLQSNPLEIIVVTVPRCRARLEKLVSSVLTDKVTILTAPLANKRQQIAIGAKAAKGKIIALVDDDAYWRASTVIPYLLAPFEKAEVGSVAGLQSPEIPEERQNADTITKWEAAGAFDMHKMNEGQPVRFAADQSSWVLVGRTCFVRACIVQDARFVDAYTHQVVNNTIVNGADDVFVTEWVMDHGWEICVQNAPEAGITSDVKRDWRFALQNLRWERGNWRCFYTRIFESPGYWAMRRRHPYLTGKLVEKLTRPIWAFAYVASWLRTLWTAPWLAGIFILWMMFGLHGWVPTYRGFAKQYPYMAGKIWFLFFMESIAPIIDFYTFATMNDDRWLTRTADAQYVKEEPQKHHDGSSEKFQSVGEKFLKLSPLIKE